MCGATPKYLSLSFIIEEGFTMTEFWEVLTNIKAAADKANVKIVTGDTKVVEKGKGDKYLSIHPASASFIPKPLFIITIIEAGDVIIVSGNIASHGIAIMSLRKGLEFETTIESDTTNLNHIVISLVEKLETVLNFCVTLQEVE